MAQYMARAGAVLKSALLPAILIGAISAASGAADDCRIVAFGDSLVTAYGLDIAEGFPAQLEQALQAEGFDCQVVDAGVSGDTTAGGLARLDWMLADRPSHVIVELGANDALRALPPAETKRNLEAIVVRLKEEGLPILLAGMLAPPNLGRTYGEAFEAVFPDVAERHELAFYPFFLDGVAGQPQLNQPDGLHPTAEGIAVIVERMLPTVTAWLEDTSG